MRILCCCMLLYVFSVFCVNVLLRKKWCFLRSCTWKSKWKRYATRVSISSYFVRERFCVRNDVFEKRCVSGVRFFNLMRKWKFFLKVFYKMIDSWIKFSTRFLVHEHFAGNNFSTWIDSFSCKKVDFVVDILVWLWRIFKNCLHQQAVRFG